jgi:hypothetical protein
MPFSAKVIFDSLQHHVQLLRESYPKPPVAHWASRFHVVHAVASGTWYAATPAHFTLHFISEDEEIDHA